ncbi:MAG: hypothetical protein FWF86_08975, partial [Clostridia bacterium]|nr:hypothetical protein [Clostridia bacterium]
MGQRSPKKIWFSWLLAAALMIPAAGLAETPSPITIAGFDIRYEPLEGELCLTKEEIPEEAPPLLGADEAAIRRAMEAGSLYLLILTADGRQVSLRIAPASGMASPSGLPAAEGLGSAFNEGPLGEQALQLLQRDGGYR